MDNNEELQEDDFMDDFGSDMLTSFMDTATTSALALTEMVIDNNRHNEKVMTEEDIYSIYNRSFAVAVTTMSQNPTS